MNTTELEIAITKYFDQKRVRHTILAEDVKSIIDLKCQLRFSIDEIDLFLSKCNFLIAANNKNGYWIKNKKECTRWIVYNCKKHSISRGIWNK